jgi:apolipoprotein N-acyltransferase
MASVLDMKRLGLGLLATALMAVLIFFGTGLDPFWPLMWFAPLPVLLFANRASWWAAALAGGCGVMLGFLNLWSVIHGLLQVPPPILAQIYLSEGIAYALAISLYRALVQRGAHWMALLAFPAAVVSFEYFLDVTSPHGTSGSLAYSQLHFLPFLQLATITGPWGMSFLLLAFSTAIAVGLHLYPVRPMRALQLVGGTVAVLILVLALGTVRLYSPVKGPMVKVGLVASDGVNRENDDVLEPGAPADKLFAQYAAPVQALAAQGAQVVVLPEKIAVVLDQTEPETDAFFQKLVDQSGTAIVVGELRIRNEGKPPLKKKYNEARVYLPGRPPLSYDKQHMLPPFESNLTPGDSLTVLPRLDAVWGVEICKDMDFTPLAAAYGKKGVGLMLVPGWDFVADWLFHGHMAIMRGVESGFSIVRSAKQGSLYVSDDRGRVLAEVKSDSAPFATLLVTVPAVHDETFEETMGDWFAMLSVLLLVLALGRLGMLWKRPHA